MASDLAVVWLRASAPGGGEKGSSIERLRARSAAALMPLKRKRWLPCPTWFEEPSQRAQPTVHPFENQ